MLMLMQCSAEVGGIDAWQSSGCGFWDMGSQWWTGWHLPGPAGAPGLMQWSWPNPDWLLIGFERWEYFKNYPHSRRMEATYQHP